MTNDEILRIIEQYVKEKCNDDSSGHDWYHIERVKNISLMINKVENGDDFTILMIATLHDLYDHKFYNGDIYFAIKNLFTSLSIISFIEEEIIENIAYSCKYIGFTENIKNKRNLSLEGKIVQDADRIDALGAIGIARTFAMGAKFNNLLYDSKNENTKTTIKHFYDKLLKLKDTMNTITGKNIANNRHKYMEEYLKEFYLEWDGKK